MKSIHFNQVPNMKGRKSMPFTDVIAENYKERERAKEAEKEMRREEAIRMMEVRDGKTTCVLDV